MALTDIATAKVFLRLNTTDTSQDQWLAQLVPAACQIVKNYCKRELETASYTDYLSGNGIQYLPVRQRPVLVTSLTGTTSNSSAVVTALSDTSTLAYGMSTSGTGIPAGTNILTVDSSSQVTLTNRATASGSVSLSFGPGVWLDAAGFGGRGVSGFASTTLLREGYDWLLDYSPGGNTQSNSGNLIRLGGGITGTTLDSMWLWDWRKGSLTTRMAPVWMPGIKNVKVVYRAGYGTGPAFSGGTLPEDLTNATNMVVAWIRRNGPLGGILNQETIGQYSYQLAHPFTHGIPPDVGEVRQILSRYRELVI